MTSGLRWRIFVLQVGLIGILAFVSGFAFWASSFATSTVHDQLAAQQIYFPAAGSQAITSLPKADASGRDPVRGPGVAHRPAGSGLRQQLHQRPSRRDRQRQDLRSAEHRVEAAPNDTKLAGRWRPSSRARRSAACCSTPTAGLRSVCSPATRPSDLPLQRSSSSAPSSSRSSAGARPPTRDGQPPGSAADAGPAARVKGQPSGHRSPCDPPARKSVGHSYGRRWDSGQIRPSRRVTAPDS